VSNNQDVSTAMENTRVQGVMRMCVDSDVAYFLFRGKEVVLIGAGRREHLPLFEHALKMKDLTWTDVRAILLPNAEPGSFAGMSSIHERCKAPVYIHRLEESKLAMRSMENAKWNLRRAIETRRIRNYGCRQCAPDLFISDGDVLDLWYGLTVIGLPGYSAGNCGFFCRHLNIIFTGSLPMRPGLFSRLCEKLSIDDETLGKSRTKVDEMKPSAILES